MSSFAEDVEKFVKKTGVKLDLVVRKVSLDAYRAIVMKTPVDTGRARASWRIAVNRVDMSTAPEMTKTDSTAARVMGANDQGAAKIAQAQWGDTVLITNNLPYIVSLERGSSKQAPHGMVRITVAEVEAHFHLMVQKLK